MTLDANGNVSSPVWPPSAAYTASYAYDQIDRMIGVYEGTVATRARIAGFGYNTLSQRTSMSYWCPAGMTTR